MFDGYHSMLACPDQHLIRSAAGVAQQAEDGVDPPFGLDAELQPQWTLLEYLDAVAEPVVPAVLRRPDADPRCPHEPPADRQAVADLGVEPGAAGVGEQRVVHAAHRLLAPPRLGSAHRIAAPRRRDAGSEAQRRVRRQVVADRDRHPALGEPGCLVHEQPAHADVDRQSRDAIGEDGSAKGIRWLRDARS